MIKKEEKSPEFTYGILCDISMHTKLLSGAESGWTEWKTLNKLKTTARLSEDTSFGGDIRGTQPTSCDYGTEPQTN